jgi:acyl-CoA synthetase (AMP-forming)/AMP-acid ligase II
MFHVSGLLGFAVSGPTLRQKLVFPPPGKWDETVHLELSAQHHVSGWSGVPTQYWRLLRHPNFADYDLSSLATAASGGAVFSPELVRLFKEKLPHVVLSNGFGMTESCGWGALAGGPIFEARPDSVGVASVLCQVEVRDPVTGMVVPAGEVGEIHLRHPSIFLGYWDNDAATADVLDADRWYRTGDYGRVDQGVLVLESRMRDLIIRGGENIYPIEIENRLIEHPAVADAAVIGVDHEVLGQEVKAFVVVTPGATIEPAEVQQWVAEALARFKVPTHVELRESLPYSLTGKVLKTELESSS